MGTNYNGEEHNGAVIPKVVETIFSRIEKTRDSIEYLVRVSFIEVFLPSILSGPLPFHSVSSFY